MATKGRGIRILKKEYEGRVDDFNKLAKKATENYANSTLEYSQDQVALDFNLTTSCLRNLMDYAITEALVSRETAEGIMYKSVKNQQRKHPEAGGTSIRHHRDLIRAREDKIAANFDSFDIDMMVYEMVHGSKDLEETMRIYKIESRRVYSLLVKRAIVEGFCSDNEVDCFFERSLRSSLTLEKISLFRQMIERRVEYKRKKEEENN